jgi:hypothetical protein
MGRFRKSFKAVLNRTVKQILEASNVKERCIVTGPTTYIKGHSQEKSEQQTEGDGGGDALGLNAIVGAVKTFRKVFK